MSHTEVCTVFMAELEGLPLNDAILLSNEASCAACVGETWLLWMIKMFKKIKAAEDVVWFLFFPFIFSVKCLSSFIPLLLLLLHVVAFDFVHISMGGEKMAFCEGNYKDNWTAFRIYYFNFHFFCFLLRFPAIKKVFATGSFSSISCSESKHTTKKVFFTKQKMLKICYPLRPSKMCEQIELVVEDIC